jgi:hypothetical protein
VTESDQNQVVGAGGIPSAEAFGTPTIRTSRSEAWLQLGLAEAFARLRHAMSAEHRDASRVWPALFETVAWLVANAERQGIRHDQRTAVEFVRDGVVHGTFDAIEPREGEPATWYWRATELLEPPTHERNRGKVWRQKRSAYDRELAGRRMIETLEPRVAELT